MRMCAANVEGFAYLCFFDDGSWFQVKIRVWGCISPYKLQLVSQNWIGSDRIIPRVNPITLKTF